MTQVVPTVEVSTVTIDTAPAAQVAVVTDAGVRPVVAPDQTVVVSGDGVVEVVVVDAPSVPQVVQIDDATVHLVEVGMQGPAGAAAPLRVGAVAWTTPLTINWTGVDLVRLRLEGPTTAMTFTGAEDGQRVLLELQQDSVGGRTVQWPPNVRFSSMATPIVLSPLPDKLDRVGFLFRADSGTYDVVAVMTGY